jgi:ATP-dependent RNA helicase DDX41
MNDTQQPPQLSEDHDDEAKRLEEWRRKREERRRQRHGHEEEANGPDPLALGNRAARDDGNNHHNGDEGNLMTMMLLEEDENIDTTKNEEDGAEEDTAYLTAAKRRKLEQEAVLLESTMAVAGTKKPTTAARRRMELLLQQQQQQNQNQSSSSTQQAETSTTAEATKKATAPAFVSASDDGQPSEGNDAAAAAPAATSLLEQAEELHRNMSAQDREDLARKEEETRLLREASKVQTNALLAAKEVASGLVYKDPMPSTWTAPKYILRQGEKMWNKVRTEWHILAEGTDIPPPMKRFADMKFPAPILQALEAKGIHRPTPIQMQGLPVALAGRDMVGIAFTGSGKTLTFALPLVMVALEEELRMPIVAREGPVGIILAPSRELARQTFDIVQEYCAAISGAAAPDGQPFPNLTAQLMIGGESVRDQLQPLQARGVHCVVGTPGRVRDVLKRKAVTLSICRYICLDEADRMLDLGFDEEVGEIMNYFPHQRQTLLFSATFPKKFQDFARQCLVQPIVVNVGRAGAANLDVIQEVEYVKEEAKIVYLLHCLQKTAPPVIIFCERKGSADDIHEYLLLKGVEAVSIHGGKDQEERNEAIRLFKMGKKDVLIATDIAAKGLDFPDIQHVINFDMPSEIENYVHRIGRTGRCGKTGVATTFINKSCDETTLLDLKGLLKEARQRIPPVLMMLDDPRDKNGGAGCSFCGGLGHTIVDCPKIDKDARRVAGSHRDVISGGGDW